MGQPRFLIVTRQVRTTPGLSTDLRRAAGSGNRGEAAAAETVWRLLGANNRDLGRSQDGYPDVPSCRLAVEWLRENLERGRPLLSATQQGQLWRWRLDFDGASLAASARAYRRQRECQYNLARFLDGVRSVQTGPVGRVSQAGLVHEVTIVIVTHNMQQAQRVSDQCAFFLSEHGVPGGIVEHGPTSAMFESPADPRTFDYVNGRFG